MSRPLRSSLSIALALGLCAIGTGCPKKDEGGQAPGATGASGESAALLAQVKSGLAEREKKLQSYHLEGTVAEAGKTAAFQFDYRAPNKMKGTVHVDGENDRTYSFDGDRLFLLAPVEKTVVVSELPKNPQESAVMLTQLFGQFAPEGFRAPVIELDKATAKKVTHGKAPEAVEVSSTTKDESGNPITVTYTYRLPTMDLLEKRLAAGGSEMTLTVDDEQCDERAKICVPKKLTQKYGSEPGAVTTLSKIDFNAQVPNDAFTIAAPEGFTVKKQDVKEGTQQQ